MCEEGRGAVNPGSLMRRGGLGMKVEAVTTPEGCWRQTSKKSSHSSAFIAKLPTPMSLCFFTREPVCLHTSYGIVFPF